MVFEVAQLLSPKPMKRDVASFSGTHFEMPPKTGCNWSDETAKL